tara:strand:- start:415 stop:3033 length:2619 start_codon:yes stop_codon:yes gene_type:complete
MESLKDYNYRKNYIDFQKMKEFKSQDNYDFVLKNLDKLKISIKNLEVSVRTFNCLSNLGIKDVGELIQLSEAYLIRSPNFGMKSLTEIKERLTGLNLALNTNIIWPMEEDSLQKTNKEMNDKHLEEIKNLEEKQEHNFIEENFEKLSTPIDKIGFSLRTTNCLKDLNIKELGNLIIISENELIKTKNFGRKSLSEIKKILSGLNLKLNTSINWPPINYNSLKKRISKNQNFLSYFDPVSKKLNKIDLDKTDLKENYLLDLIKSFLNEREYLILKNRYWKGLTLEEIGQIEKVTRERIRQIESKVIRKIRRAYLIFDKFLESNKNEIFLKYSSTENLITYKSLSKVKDKYPLNTKDGLINLSYDVILEKQLYKDTDFEKKKNFFDKFFHKVDGGWLKYHNDNFENDVEELIYYLDKKPLPRQCESARNLSKIQIENFKDIAKTVDAKTDYYLINNYFCENKNKFGYLSNSYLVKMHEVLFNASPNTFIENEKIMSLLREDKFLRECAWSKTIIRAKDLIRGKGLVDTSHLFYVSGAGIIPLGIEKNNTFENINSDDNIIEDIDNFEEETHSEKLSKYLKIIESILEKNKAISLKRLSEIYVKKIEQNIKPQQTLKLLGILLSSYENFIQIGPGVWSLKKISNANQNLANYILKNKESYPVDMYSLIKFSNEDLSKYPGCGKNFEKEICTRGKEILSKDTYDSFVHVSNPETWSTSQATIKKFQEQKRISNFYLNVKTSGSFNLEDEKKIRSYDIDNLGFAILNIFQDKTVSIVGLNTFFDYSLFWNTSASILVLLSYAGFIETPNNNLRPHKVNSTIVNDIRNLILKEIIENGNLSWNREFGKKIVKMIKSNYSDFIIKDNWITEDLRLKNII